jgi:hypothetical protein
VLIILVGTLSVLFVRRRATDLSKDTLPAESEVTLTGLRRPALADVFPRIDYRAHCAPPALSETETVSHYTPTNLPANSPRGFPVDIPRGFPVDIPRDLPADIPQVLIPGGAAWRPLRKEH